jgi:cell division protein FtsL
MILRLLNLIVIGALVLAAAYVYRIKFDATVQAERLARIRSEVRHERDGIAALRAEWSQLDNPARIESLAKRYLHLKPITPQQFDQLDHLPDRPPDWLRADSKDPIGGMIENLEEPDSLTGSLPTQPGAPDASSGSANKTPAPQAASPATGGAVNR